MPSFRYKAYAADGVRETGRQVAATEEFALERLAELGLTVTEIELETEAIHSVKAGKRPSLTQQADLAEQLGVLFAAGLPAPQVTSIIAKTSNNVVIRRHFRRIEQLISEGVPFDQALAQGASPLSPMFSILAGIGQHAGAPGQQMSNLAASLRRQAKLSAQIGSALIYPAILIVGGLCMVVFMALFLAPRLSIIFDSVGQTAPSSIAGFMTLGNWLTSGYFPTTLIGIGIATSVLLRKQAFSSFHFALHLPMLGQALREAGIVRIVRAVQLMLEAGLPLAPALRMAAESFALDPAARSFLAAAAALEQGNRAGGTLAEIPHLPTLLRELFIIGEEANNLPHMLSAIAAGLEDSVEQRLGRIMTVLTPVLTLMIGGVIAMVVTSVMGAVLSVNELAF